jgi:hypothetical protein
MNTPKNNLPDVLWKGEPWTAALHDRLPRPSQRVREVVYASARNAAAQRVPAGWTGGVRRLRAGDWAVYSAWVACAGLLLAVCVWLGSPGPERAPVAETEFSSVVVAAADVLDSTDMASQNDGDYVDMGEVALADELASIDEQLAYLEAELTFDVAMAQNL